MSINDFLKSCIKRPDGRLLCWDNDAKQCVVVEFKREAVSIADITEAEFIALKTKVDANNTHCGLTQEELDAFFNAASTKKGKSK